MLVKETNFSTFQHEDGHITSIFGGFIDFMQNKYAYAGKNVDGKVQIVVYADVYARDYRKLESEVFHHVSSLHGDAFLEPSSKSSMTVESIINFAKDRGMRTGELLIKGTPIHDLPKDAYFDELYSPQIKEGAIQYGKTHTRVISLKHSERKHIQAAIQALNNAVSMENMMNSN